MTDQTPVGFLRRERPVVRRVQPRAILVAVAGLLVAACGGEAEAPEEAADATVVESATTEAEGEGNDRTIVTTDEDAAQTETGDADAADADATTTTTEEDASTTTDSATTDAGELAGEPLDFGPSAGTPLAIVGVAFDDSLNFRAEPSPDADVLASFGPLSEDLDTSALGEAWAAPSGVWWKVNVAGTEAWANQAFLGSLGSSINGYDQLSAELDVFEYETIEAAALAVAALRSSEDPESRVVLASEPLAFETGGFVVVDVLDLGDDSVKGERIRVDVQTVFDEESGEEGAQDVDYFRIVDIELTPICGRGVSDGLCT